MPSILRKFLAISSAALVCTASQAGAPGPSVADSQANDEVVRQELKNYHMDNSNSVPIAQENPNTAAAKNLINGTPSEIATLSDFRIEFAVRFSAFKGEAILELRPGDTRDSYVKEVSTRAKGLARLAKSGTTVERSYFRNTPNGLLPTRYELIDGSGKAEDNTEIDFNWDQLIAKSVHESIATDLDLEVGLLDRLTADLQTILDLQNGRIPRQQRMAYNNGIRQYELESQGNETITVPAGTFKTIKILRRRQNSTRTTIIWYAEDADYLPVRIEQFKNGESTIVMTASRIDSTQYNN